MKTHQGGGTLSMDVPLMLLSGAQTGKQDRLKSGLWELSITTQKGIVAFAAKHQPFRALAQMAYPSHLARPTAFNAAVVT